MLPLVYTSTCHFRRKHSESGCSTEAAPPNRLTPQPFLPKLRLTKHMRLAKLKMQLVVVFLVVAFLGAQIHFCTDLLESTGSHVCPTCSAANSAAPTITPHLAALVPVQTIELHAFALSTRPAFALLLSLRAPPAL